MTGSAWVDLIVLAGVVVAAVSGFRQGAVASAMAFVGVVLGAAAGVLLAPHVIDHVEDSRMRLLAGIGLLAGLVIVGEIAGMVLGRAARSFLPTRTLRRIDSLVGAAVQAIALLLAAWLLAIPLTSSATPVVSRAIRGSAVLAEVDRLAPQFVKDLPQKFSRVVDTSGLPDVLGPFGRTPIIDVDPPDVMSLSDPVVERVRGSVLRIDGQAPGCQRALEGTGFVVSPGRILTNAHVVAGTTALQVRTAEGELPARPVAFDPQTDLAILAVPGLRAPVLPVAADAAHTGDAAFALGYPGGGPLTLSSARIRSKQVLDGANIYRVGEVRREVYTIRGQVRPGNSGGPLFNAAGQVIGVVFGVAVDDADTGFALTAQQVGQAFTEAPSLTSRVSTGQCVTEG
ncbi:MarP family serine protease [Tsukamurella sp. 8F]|uniref:MarP family serine protease n=1 Tax=unclassified Tsukamurella TaxID=2633480 RepID=UPI0023B93D5E|nr:MULTISPECIES: MarP family serine protease [unclassified Tsukamurella]MDF0529604.1 MarP family serine protease [Tsukamurella sp. 8J]MDF0585708.1 MarP family serine protease [Tsukamurella sp. 8F]